MGVKLLELASGLLHITGATHISHQNLLSNFANSLSSAATFFPTICYTLAHPFASHYEGHHSSWAIPFPCVCCGRDSALLHFPIAIASLRACFGAFFPTILASCCMTEFTLSLNLLVLEIMESSICYVSGVPFIWRGMCTKYRTKK